jgi:hypothetical protein
MTQKYNVRSKTVYGQITVTDGKVTETYAALRFMIGWDIETVKRYCEERQWKIKEIDQ